MSKQLSFTKYENEILHNYRKKLNTSESTEDVKKFFVYAIRELFDKIFSGKIEMAYEDAMLIPDNEPYYKLQEHLLTTEAVSILWKDSDLPRVVARFAESAARRYKHLEKHPEKTDAKIRN